jgi:hypothetical protein
VGFFLTALERNELRELCRDATNATVHQHLAGEVSAEDSSQGKMLIQYCLFDEDQYLDGFYIITGWSYAPQTGWPNYYPWSLDLVFLGTRALLLEGYVVGEVRDVENEWDI